jgi:ribosome assembly protein YihI (activator of Der GTPase)
LHPKSQPSMYKNFELTSLAAFFDDDQLVVHEYLEVVVDDWFGLKQELEIAIENKNSKEYRSIVNRMLAPMRLLKMAELQNLLNNGNARIDLSDAPENQIYFRALLDKVADFLEELTESLPAIKSA